MKPECSRIASVILPAIRASVAEDLYRKHNLRQADIADSLGIVQVAVSKYLNGKYSVDIAKLKEYISRNGLNCKVVSAIVNNEGKQEINSEIESLCTNKAIFEFA